MSISRRATSVELSTCTSYSSDQSDFWYWKVPVKGPVASCGRDTEPATTYSPLGPVMNQHHSLKLHFVPNTMFYSSTLTSVTVFQPVPVVTRSKARVFGRSPAEIVGSNPTRGMDVCLLRVMRVVKLITRPEESPTVVCRCVWSRNLVNEKALAHLVLLRPQKKSTQAYSCY